MGLVTELLKEIIRNRWLYKVIFLNFSLFGSWASDLGIFDLNIGFLVKNCIYGQLGTSRIPKFDEHMTNKEFSNF